MSVIDTNTDELAATIDVALVRGGPKSAIPNGLDVSPDGRTLYVALSGENAVAVVDLDSREVSRWDFSKGDDQPEVALNRAIWKSIKGRHSKMPHPRHELIIGTVPNDEDEQLRKRTSG